MPTTPNEYARFIQANAARFPQLRAGLNNQLGNIQNLRNVAMVAGNRLNPGGTITGNTNVLAIRQGSLCGALVDRSASDAR